MKLRVIQQYHGEAGTWEPGEIVEVTKEQAYYLLGRFPERFDQIAADHTSAASGKSEQPAQSKRRRGVK
jgi:hypothetical protein